MLFVNKCTWIFCKIQAWVFAIVFIWFVLGTNIIIMAYVFVWIKIYSFELN